MDFRLFVFADDQPVPPVTTTLFSLEEGRWTGFPVYEVVVMIIF